MWNFRLMDRCSNSGESSQRRERDGRERVSRRKIKVREKVGSVFFRMFDGSAG